MPNIIQISKYWTAEWREAWGTITPCVPFIRLMFLGRLLIKLFMNWQKAVECQILKISCNFLLSHRIKQIFSEGLFLLQRNWVHEHNKPCLVKPHCLSDTHILQLAGGKLPETGILLFPKVPQVAELQPTDGLSPGGLFKPCWERSFWSFCKAAPVQGEHTQSQPCPPQTIPGSVRRGSWAWPGECHCPQDMLAQEPRFQKWWKGQI